jgi:hypothetical protein
VTTSTSHPREELIPNLRDTFKKGRRAVQQSGPEPPSGKGWRSAGLTIRADGHERLIENDGLIRTFQSRPARQNQPLAEEFLFLRGKKTPPEGGAGFSRIGETNVRES